MFNLPQNGFKYATDRRASRRGTKKPKKKHNEYYITSQKGNKKVKPFYITPLIRSLKLVSIEVDSTPSLGGQREFSTKGSIN